MTVTAPNNSFSLLEALESEFIESDFMKSGQTKESEGMLQQRALWTRTRVARLAGGGKTSRLLVTLTLSLPLLRPLGKGLSLPEPTPMFTVVPEAQQMPKKEKKKRKTVLLPCALLY